MKILLLNPKDDALQELLPALKQRKVAVLRPSNIEEAWQMLLMHGKSVDLAILHREDESGKGEPGLRLAEKMKADPVQTDLPFILTSSQWNEEACAVHQGGSKAPANAYVSGPIVASRMLELIEQVTGQTLPAPEAPLRVPSSEEPTGMVQIPEPVEIQGPSVQLDGFELETPKDPTRGQGIAREEATRVAAFRAPEPEEPAAEIASELPIEMPEEPYISEEATRVARPIEASSEPEVDFQTAAEADAEAADKMPYLFGDRKKAAPSPKVDPSQFLGPAFGDAVVPGGAAHSPDAETLRKYLMLREQDVVALSAQLKSAYDQIRDLEASREMERAQSAELAHLVKQAQAQREGLEQEMRAKTEAHEEESNELRFQLKAKHDKVRVLEVKVRETLEQMESLKERVRLDIRKIRVREKDLENKLEIQKRDAEALIVARENKIIELKRKLDLLEFNMDLLQEQLAREKEINSELKKKLFRVSQAMKVAGGLIDEKEGGSESAAAAESSDHDDTQAEAS